MTRTSRANLLLPVLCLWLTLFAACGGYTSNDPQPVAPTTAVVKISATGQLDPGRMIGGITVSGVLPAGVTIKAAPDAQNSSVLVAARNAVLASGVVGKNASALATYNAATRKVNIQVYDQDGFGTGEFVTVTCDILSGTTPTAGGFGLEGFTAKDLNGVDINGLTATITVDLR
jgi:hypothetical protein